MTVAAKCNITSFVLQELGDLLYGLKCKDNSNAIVENYIEYLQCPTVVPEICHPADCQNEPIIFNCSFNITGIAVVVNGNTATFTVIKTGGTAPFTYLWTFDSDDWTSGALNQSSLVLTTKPGKDIVDLVSQVTITITDTNGCTDNKSCWIVGGVMKCTLSFVPCVNPSDLVVLNSTVYCVAPVNLQVEQS